MNHKERFFAIIERNEVDKPASWLGLPASSALEGLYSYFNVKSVDELKVKLDDDIYPIDVPYHSPISNHVACAFPFAKEGTVDYEKRTLTAPGFFEDYSDPSKINDFDWPDPSLYIDPAECKRLVENTPNDMPILGVMWSAHFQDTLSAFGMEKAFVKMYSRPKMFQAVIERIADFYLDANKIFYEATKGKLDAVLIGNDFGGQRRLMVPPKKIQEHVWPTTKKIINQAKEYNLKVIFHSCGSIYPLIPDLIELGVDVIHPIQALAADMNAEKLKKEFGDKVSFCGGVDAQQLLVNGTPKEVYEDVLRLRKLFPTGLIISPSHEAILPDVNPANIDALFKGINAK